MESIKTKDAFQLKGSLFTLTVLQLLDTNSELITDQLEKAIAKSPKFFQHAPIVIELSQLNESEQMIDFAALRSTLCEHNLIPVGVRGGNAKQHQHAQLAGIAVLPDNKANAALASRGQTKPKSPSDLKKTKMITTPVRSGQQIYAENCDLIITGSVGNGAEVIADGNIHIYGTLRGRALAGANGDQSANIFCRSLQAEMVSIAGRYRLPDDNKTSALPKTDVRIYLSDGRICIDAC